MENTITLETLKATAGVNEQTLQIVNAVHGKYPYDLGTNFVPMTMREVLERLSVAGPGQIHTVYYLTIPTQKRLSGLYTISMYSVRLSDYESLRKVKQYRETTGVQANNPAVINEIPLVKSICLYYNTATRKIKLRVPTNGMAKPYVHYFIDGVMVDKQTYQTEWTKRGYALPNYTNTVQDFRAFDVARIVCFK